MWIRWGSETDPFQRNQNTPFGARLALTETLEKIAAAEAAAAQCLWGEVRQHLHSLASAGPPAGVTVEQAEASARRIRSLQWRAAAFWWQPLRGAGVVLRRTAADDAEFY